MTDAVDMWRARRQFRLSELGATGRRARSIHLVDWRESACAVAEAYARWSFASGPERAMRFAAYTATFDQEHQTAAAYAETVTDVERRLERSASHGGLEQGNNAPRRYT